MSNYPRTIFKLKFKQKTIDKLQKKNKNSFGLELYFAVLPISFTCTPLRVHSLSRYLFTTRYHIPALSHVKGYKLPVTLSAHVICVCLSLFLSITFLNIGRLIVLAKNLRGDSVGCGETSPPTIFFQNWKMLEETGKHSQNFPVQCNIMTVTSHGGQVRHG